jgi:hypothetical protein
MKTWVKVVAIAVPAGIAVLSATVYGCWLIASKAVPEFQNQVSDPKFAASVTRAMISISDPPPGNFTYTGAVDMLLTKVVVMTRGEHFIILVQTRQSKAQHSLRDAIAGGHNYGPIAASSFEGDKSGELPVADGSFEYEIGNFKAQGGGSFRGVIGLLKNAEGQPRVLIESFDRSRKEFDFAATKQFLDGITAIK